MTNDLAQKLEVYLASEAFQLSIEDSIKKTAFEIERAQKIDKILQQMPESEVRSLFQRLFYKHDQRWEDLCYSKNVQPYPWNLLNYLFTAAQNFGKDYEGESLDDFDKHFGAFTMEYLGYYFNWIYGQGTVLRIFDKNKQEIFRS